MATPAAAFEAIRAWALLIGSPARLAHSYGLLDIPTEITHDKFPCAVLESVMPNPGKLVTRAMMRNQITTTFSLTQYILLKDENATQAKAGVEWAAFFNDMCIAFAAYPFYAPLAPGVAAVVHNQLDVNYDGLRLIEYGRIKYWGGILTHNLEINL